MSEQEYPQSQLDAALQAVKAQPGRTAAEVAPYIPSGQKVGVPRETSLKVLRALEGRHLVERRTGQHAVAWYPATEAGGET